MLHVMIFLEFDICVYAQPDTMVVDLSKSNQKYNIGFFTKEINVKTKLVIVLQILA